MEALLSLVDITRRHGGRAVLKGVRLDVRPGEVMGLIGENGVGKSTLVNILAGSYPPDGGTIVFEGQPLQVHSQSEALARGIGIIKQDLNPNPRLTVAQAIHRTGPLSGHPHAELRGEAVRQLREHGFGLSADARLGRLTPLERTMVEMARLAIGGARLLLLDEVGATFSRREIEILHDVLARMSSRGASALYISHRLAEVQQVCDRAAILRDGRVHAVVDTARTTVDEMTSLLLTREPIRPGDRTGHRRDEIALQVTELGLVGPDGEPELDGISLELHRGEILGLTGPARRGGMHQLALALTGNAEGTVDGKAARSGGPARTLAGQQPLEGVGYFSSQEQPRLDEDATLAGFLSPAAGVEDPEELAAMRRIITLISSLDIHATSPREGITKLSGGDRHKVFLHRWMASAPEIVILDHPSRGLDVRSRQDLFEQLVRHTASGGSVVLISSDPAELLAWCDRIALLRNGRLDRIVNPDQTDEAELDAAMVAPPARALATDDVTDDSQADGFEGLRAQRFLVEWLKDAARSSSGVRQPRGASLELHASSGRRSEIVADVVAGWVGHGTGGSPAGPSRATRATTRDETPESLHAPQHHRPARAPADEPPPSGVTPPPKGSHP